MDSSDDEVWVMSSEDEQENRPPPKAKTPKAAAKPKAKTKPKAKPRAALQSISSNQPSDDEEEAHEQVTSSAQVHKSSSQKQSIEQIYQKKTQLEHILLRPDTYVGSIEPVTQPMWVYDEVKNCMENRKITYVPGLYKIFDEIIVNACDNKQRDHSMDTIKVTIDVNQGELSVWNNGKGIPIALHKEHQVYVPELIFGHLLTGSNFDDKKKKTTGGRNGYGAKLTNIFSTRFVIETADAKSKQKYRQVFGQNMSEKQKPVISSYNGKGDYTCVTFRPDLQRFKMDHLDQDIVALFKKRVYDVAGVTDKSLKVFLNNERISIKSFAQYVEMYRGGKSASQQEEENEDCGSGGDSKSSAEPVIFDKPDDRWQVGIGVSDDGFQQVSFVNGICTTKGGQHVNYIVDQVIHRLTAVIKKKNKGEAVKPAHIKNHMWVYVTALIDNPAFDSQTKETLTTRPPSFGSSFTLSDKFLKQIEKSGMVEHILSFAKFKQTAELRRKGAQGSRKSKLTGIAKLDDANFAGSAKGKDCTLILTEGDSAKALAMSGLAVVGRDFYGVFPLRGKLLNVREASHSQILKNEEITNIVKILGLKYGQKYESTKGLRYGHLMIMADQDHDGSHIKGLVINFLHHFWPSLLQVEDFVQEFITPIVKCSKGNRVQVFYTMPEYQQWREENNNGRGWRIKYYKGLGTSTAKEAKEYFSDLRTHQINFAYQGNQDGDSIDMAFSKKRVEERKDWLRGFEQGTFVNYDVEEMAYSEFVNKELILFSMADNMRSIPCVVDGFKPSQRKVLFCCFKRNLKNEIKVAQLAGYVSEHSAYHHGEMSLNGTIINMAQDFVGSNNVNLLSPNGQFGTRALGGKDAASPRYVFTKLEQVSWRIFNPLDNEILNYLDEDGQSIEPEWYMPIIPMALVNGSEGIGTGWSSNVPNYNPLDVIRNLRLRINNEPMEPMVPWYRGFNGKIIPKISRSENETFLVQGLYEVPDESTLVITELPVKSWTQNYKQFLETLLESGAIKDFKENHTDTTVLFTISMEPAKLQEIVNAPGGIMKRFKLEASLSTSNMHMFDSQGRIRKYESPHEVMEEFFTLRLEFYDKRKQALLAKLQDQIKCLENKTRFILSVVKGELKVSNRKKKDLLEELETKGFDRICPKTKKHKQAEPEGEGEDADLDGDESMEDAEKLNSKGYDYLLSMQIWSLTKERVEKLQSELQEKQQEHDDLSAKTIETLWLEDLEELEDVLVATEEEKTKQAARATASIKRKAGAVGRGRRKPAAKPKKSRVKKFIASSDEESGGGDDDEAFSDSDYEEVSAPKRPTPKPRATKTREKPNNTKANASTAPRSPKAEKTKPKKEDVDVEVLSLAERLAQRVQVTPKKQLRITDYAATSAPNATSTALFAAGSSPKEEVAMDSQSDDDVFAFEANKSKTQKPPRKIVKPKAATATAKPKGPAKKSAKSAVQHTTKAAPAPRSRAPKRAKEKTPKKAPAPRAGGNSLVMETPPRASPAPKKQRIAKKSAVDLDENDDEEQDEVPRRRGGRVRNRITYEEVSDSEDGDEEMGSRNHNKKSSEDKEPIIVDDSSEFSADEDDDDSDFE